MAIHVKEVNKHFPQLNEIKEMLTELFPPSEVAPFWFMLARAKEKFVDFLAFYDNDQLIGFSYLISQNDLTNIIYLATPTKVHSKGYGSQILSLLKQRFVNNRFVLTIDELDETASNYAQRLKRKDFYAKNDFFPNGLKVQMRKNRFEVLVYNGNCTIKEMQNVQKRYMGYPIYWFYKTKEIK